MESWFRDAKRINSLEAEICFLLQDDFYYGPDSHPEVEERKEIEPLPSPDIVRQVPSMLRTAQAIQNVDELANYYREVVRVAQKHRKTFNDIRQYFWVRFWLWNTDEDVHISFPWYDTYSEIEQFLTSVAAETDGQVFWDVDQCWELEVHAADGEMFARLRDPDYDEVHAIISFPRDALLNQIQALRLRTESIIDSLSMALGHDVWTNYTEWPEFSAMQETVTDEPRPWWSRWMDRIK